MSISIRGLALAITLSLTACGDSGGIQGRSAEPPAGSSSGNGSGSSTGSSSGSGPTRFALSVSKVGAGLGSVVSQPAGIDCGNTCTAEFDQGQAVTLTPTPGNGSTFAGFAGACSGTSACTVSMDEARTVTATFNLVPLVLEFYEAGSAKREISPSDEDIAGAELQPNGDPQFFNLGGFGTRDLICDPVFGQGCVLSSPGPATGRFHETSVRVMAITKGAVTTLYVNIDAIGAGNIILKNLRDAIATASGVDREHILIAETHSHSAADLQGLWGGVPQRWRNFLYQQAGVAAKQAVDNLQPADLVVGTKRIDYNNYRREGGDDPTSPTAVYVTDKNLTVLQARSLFGGQVLGTLTQYTAHPTVLGSGNRLVHTDYLLSLHDAIEQEYGATSVYFNGPIADASPKAPDAGPGFEGVQAQYERARLMGVGLGAEVKDALRTGVTLPLNDLLMRATTVILQVANPVFLAAGGVGAFDGYYNFTDPTSGQSGFVATRVTRVRIGSPTDASQKLEIVSIPGEATGPFGAMIRGLAGGPYTITAGLTQNTLGYILPADEFGRMGNNYEETVSLGPQTAPQLELLGYRVVFNEALPTATPMD